MAPLLWNPIMKAPPLPTALLVLPWSMPCVPRHGRDNRRVRLLFIISHNIDGLIITIKALVHAVYDRPNINGFVIMVNTLMHAVHNRHDISGLLMIYTLRYAVLKGMIAVASTSSWLTHCCMIHVIGMISVVSTLWLIHCCILFIECVCVWSVYGMSFLSSKSDIFVAYLMVV